MINYFVTRQHFYTISPFLRDWTEQARQVIRIVPYDRIDRIERLTDDIHIFTDLDRIPSATRARAVAIADQVMQSFGAEKVLNHPRRSLARLELLTLLQENGINGYQARPATASTPSLRYPVFARRGNDHLGPLTPLLGNEQQLQAALLRLGRRGIALSELLAIEYCDTRDRDGLFRKYSAFRLGPAIVPGHVIYSDAWVAKDNRKEPPRQETLDYLATNPHQEELLRIFDLAGIEYGRIDYSLKDGRIQVWEINTNPMLIGPPGKYDAPTQAQKRLLVNNLEAAFLNLDRISAPPGADSGEYPHIALSPWNNRVYELKFFLRRYLEALVLRYQTHF